MDKPKKIVVGCQGGGMHAAFEVGVLKAILENIRDKKSVRIGGFERNLCRRSVRADDLVRSRSPRFGE